MSEPAKRVVDIDALARRLPRRAPDPERLPALRSALLEAARPSPERWPRVTARGWGIGLGGLAAAACVLLALRTPDHEVASSRRSLTATDPADPTDRPRAEADKPRPAPVGQAGLTRLRAELADPVSPGAKPAIQLREGVNTFDTSHPAQLTRGDVTITAPPGARFDVDVRDDEIKRVTVKAGWVVIASSRVAATIVVEREAWTPPIATAPVTPVTPPITPPASSSDRASIAPRAAAPGRATEATAPRAPRVALPRGQEPSAVEPPPASASAPATAAAAPPPATGEQDFHDGLHALLAGDARAAVGPLDHACAISSRTQEDMCYWAAVAWLRAGDRAHARASFADVVARFPHSTHAGEASVALGWLLLEHGDVAAARTQFAAAAADPLPSVRADAQRGLAAVH